MALHILRCCQASRSSSNVTNSVRSGRLLPKSHVYGRNKAVVGFVLYETWNHRFRDFDVNIYNHRLLKVLTRFCLNTVHSVVVLADQCACIRPCR